MEAIEKYLPIFQKHWEELKIPLQSDRACVIVEPRKHKHLELVIKNVLYFVPSTWSLYIFHSKTNEQFVKDLLGAEKLSQVHLICICRDNLSIRDYSTLLVSELFWNWIEAEHVLIFQTDSYLRKRGIEEFLKYDCVGSPWATCFLDRTHHAGNGGVCLRKKCKILEAITRHTYQSPMNEDMFFQFALERTGAKLAHVEEAKKFGVETIYYEDPIACHKHWDYITDPQQREQLAKLHIDE